MKKVHILILQAFIRPFIVTFGIVMFVLLMLFLFKYIDDLIGKGLEWHVILELIGYQCAHQLSMALPLSMLLSSIMTFGNLGESYELVAIKAAGISLRKAMTPLFFLVGLFATSSFLFSDNVLPVVNLKMGSLLWDVRNKKAEFFIKPGDFNNSIPGYAIRAKGKNKEGTKFYDLIIYDHKSSTPGNNVVLAKEGYMYNSADNNYMILKLVDGVRYEESNVKGASKYDPRRQFIRFHFKESEQKFDMETFQMKRTDESLFKGLHQMLNLKQLEHHTDSNNRAIDSLELANMEDIRYNYYFLSNYYTEGADSLKQSEGLSFKDELEQIEDKKMIISSTLTQTQQIKELLESKAQEYHTFVDKGIRYDVEWHRKFTLAVSCLLLFGIGAPLGAIIRKGGLGVPVLVAIIFFLIYHIIATLAEKAAKDGSLEPFFGMWMSIIVLTPLAIFLTYKSASDSAIFDMDHYKMQGEKLLEKIRKKFPFLVSKRQPKKH